MSIIGGILLYVAGIATGAGAIALHGWDVKRAVRAVETRKNAELSKLRSAYAQLQEESGALQQASDCADAFRRGKATGRARPLSDAEQFAHTFQGRSVKFVDTTRGGTKP